MNVVEVDFTIPARDIPRMLRKLAEDIEAGTYGEVRTVVAVAYRGGGDCEVFGFGATDAYESYMVLDHGKSTLRRLVK